MENWRKVINKQFKQLNVIHTLLITMEKLKLEDKWVQWVKVMDEWVKLGQSSHPSLLMQFK